jgi:hypothetical protein
VLRAAASLTIAVALLAGCGEPAADVARDDDGRPVEAGEVRADRIRVGDCFDDPAVVDVVPCDELHDNEVFHLFDVDDGEYPGRDALESLSSRRCGEDAFEAYVGDTVGGSLYDVFQIVPSPESWADDGDRTVVCVLFGDRGVPLKGSARLRTGGDGDLDA